MADGLRVTSRPGVVVITIEHDGETSSIEVAPADAVRFGLNVAKHGGVLMEQQINAGASGQPPKE